MTPCYPVLLTVLSEALLLSIPPKWTGLFQAHCQVCLTSLRLTLHAQLQNIRTDDWQVGIMDGKGKKSSKETQKEAISSIEGGMTI
jgi:hypothetical protein